jgi:hypothetical protein
MDANETNTACVPAEGLQVGDPVELRGTVERIEDGQAYVRIEPAAAAEAETDEAAMRELAGNADAQWED